MIPYFLSWGAFALAGLGGRRRLTETTAVLVMVFLTVFIGLRDRVGGDWLGYLPAVEGVKNLPFAEVLRQVEPGYALLNWIGANLGGGVFLVNTLCALIFSIGLLRFCRAQPRPWLALTMAFPYLVVVVAMGYTRQGVAIGLEMIALLALERDQLLRYLGWIALAATFHRTVLVMLVLPAATLSAGTRFSRWIRLGLVAAASYSLYLALIERDLAYYQQGYLAAQYLSQGALIRVLLCLVPALVLLANRPRFCLTQPTRQIWSLMALLALLAGLALATVASSTAVDRLALYLIPLQLFVGARLPDTRLMGLSPTSWTQLLTGLSLAVLTVWLFFAANSYAWVPYRNLWLPL